jgi:hypothetical protein
MALGSKAADGHRGTIGSASLNSNVLGLAHLQHRTCARNQDTACSRRLYGLEVDLLVVDNMLVVEGHILRVQQVLNGLVEGVGGLRDASSHDYRIGV